MHQCFVAPQAWSDDRLVLSADEERHLRKVLRARDGDSVMAFDGAGRRCRARIATLPVDNDQAGTGRMSKGSSGLTVLVPDGPTERLHRPLELTLLQTIPKGHRMDWIVEKATELGVSRIVPIISKRVVVRLDARQVASRVRRWQRIALEAAKQCQTAWVPEVNGVFPYSEALAQRDKEGLFLLGSLGEDARPMHSVLEDVRHSSRHAALLIGPEGDLTSEEIDEAVRCGALPVSFGELTLRVETAALFGLSVLRYALTSQP